MTRRARFRDRLRRFTAAVVVALYAFLSTVGASLVLCQERDGHIAIEWRGSACCAAECAPPAPMTTTENSERVVAVGVGDTEDACNSCVDEPASNLLTSRGADAKRSASVPAPSKASAFAVAAWSHPHWTLGVAVRFAGPRVAPIPPPPLESLRTVVFRC